MGAAERPSQSCRPNCILKALADCCRPAALAREDGGCCFGGGGAEGAGGPFGGRLHRGAPP